MNSKFKNTHWFFNRKMIDIVIILVLLAVALLLLVKGADFLVDGSSDIARWLKISPMIVGLTIVAFGTSLPEFIVSLFAALSGTTDLAVANIIGSNIANIALILGLSAVLIPLAITSKSLIYEFPFLIVSSFALLILGTDMFIYQQDTYSLSRLDGVLLLILLAIFLFYLFKTIRTEKRTAKKEFRKEYIHNNSTGRNILLIVGGIVGLFIGGKLFVGNALALASRLGLSESFLGLTIAAIGTSLPELFTSGIAAWKKQGDIAVGNIVGSNIFNILFVLGITSLISPLAISQSLIGVDGIVMIAATLLLLLFATRGKNITRGEGIFLLAFYGAYLVFIFWRG